MTGRPGRARLPAIAIAGLLSSAACGARQHPPAGVPAKVREGVTSVRVLQDASATPPTAEAAVERITPAVASDENELPEYPLYALRGGCGQGLVPVRVHIGADGNVARVAPIPGRAVADDQCHSAFWAATVAAVQGWRFAPAFRQTPRPGPDVDGDGRSDYTRWDQAPVMIYLDFEFRFRVVDGKGEVLR